MHYNLIESAVAYSYNKHISKQTKLRIEDICK